MARSMSGRRLGGLLAFLMSGLLFLGAVSASATGDEELGPRRHMLALTNTDRVYHDRTALSFAERLAAYAHRVVQMADGAMLAAPAEVTQ